jgi:hypothetical protein
VILRPLLNDYNPLLIRRTGEQVLGFPPDVFGVTFEEFRRLSAALLTSNPEAIERKGAT